MYLRRCQFLSGKPDSSPWTVFLFLSSRLFPFCSLSLSYHQYTSASFVTLLRIIISYKRITIPLLDIAFTLFRHRRRNARQTSRQSDTHLRFLTVPLWHSLDIRGAFRGRQPPCTITLPAPSLGQMDTGQSCTAWTSIYQHLMAFGYC
jgi:hypothetical protein